MDPNFKKRNHHYVPQFWQRRFADATGQLYVRYSESADKWKTASERGKARPVNAKSTMAEDYANTVFDETWRPYDVLEDLLAKAEGEMKKTQDEVLNSATPIDSALRN